MSLILEVRGLEAFYGHLQVLFGIDLAVERGGITALLGANGAGKTTTLRAVCATVRTRGSVLLDGKPIEGWPTEEIVRLGVAHVPEGRGTFSGLTVGENLRLGGYLQPRGPERARNLEVVFEYFPILKERLQQQAGLLSGGEQQMLAISRALMLRPRLMILDEPSFGLAPMVVQEIFRILRRINQEQGVSMLLVEQNAKIALALADQACLLETGRLVMAGTAASLSENEAVRRAYLGS